MNRLRLATLMLAAGTLWLGMAAVSSAEEAPDAPAEGNPEAAATARVDAEIARVWQRDLVTPAGPSSDEEFLRRVYLDVTGAPPAPEETLAFLTDTQDGKRERLIDTLVADPRFGRHLADLWVPLLLGRAQKQKYGADHILAVWMAREINAGRGFDALVYDMISARGKLSENQAVAYWVGKDEQRTPDFAGLVSKHFTGVQIQCAQCHKHPYEEMTMADFAGVAGFFNGLRIRRDGNQEPQDPETADERVKAARRPSDAELAKLPEKRRAELEERLKYSSPRYLYGEAVKLEDTTLLRATYAKWVIAPENRQTRRYLANRFWSFIFGQGLQNPVDDFNSFNHPTHPELLEYLADELLASRFDLRRFYRVILKSRTYQLSSSGGSRKDAKAPEAWHYASYPVRQLTPEQFFGALLGLTTDPGSLREARKRFELQFERLRAEARRAAEDEAKRKADEPKEKAPGMERQEEGRKDETKDEKKEAKKAAKEEQKNVKKYDLAALERFEAIFREMPDGWFMRRTLCQSYASRSSDDEMTEADAFTLTIDQALQVMNGALTSRLSENRKGQPLYDILKAGTSPETRVESLYLRVLCRKPSKTESARVLDYVAEAMKGGSKLDKAWEDVLFALLMTTEFATNH